jgi:dTDP-4-dehydrorhamnose reductase
MAWSGQFHGDLLGIPVQPVNLTDPQKLAEVFARARPDVVIHTAALSRVADCYRDPALAQQTNVAATVHLAKLCQVSGTRLLFTSTDMVFDGEKGNYNEDDLPQPLSVYGQSKWAAEQAISSFSPILIVRLSLLFGSSLLPERPTFFEQQAASLRQGEPIRCFTDEWRTPLPLQEAAKSLLALAVSPVTGLLHVGGPERLSRYEMGLRLARPLGVSEKLVLPITRADMTAPEPRPRDVSLDSNKWRSQITGRR